MKKGSKGREGQAARRELAGFRSGEAYQKLRADYEGIIREKDFAIRKLQKERDREHHLQAGDRDLHRPGGHRIPHCGIL